MDKILFFNYCAIPILIILLVSAYTRRANKDRASKIFIIMTWLSLGATLIDTFQELISSSVPLSRFGCIVVYLLSLAYFLLRDSTIVVYFIYLFYVTRTEYKLRRKAVFINFAVFYGAFLLLLILNTFNGWIFRVTPESGYSRGSAIVLLYAIVFVFMICGINFLLKYRKLMHGGEWSAYLSLYIFSLFSVLVQYFFPSFVVEMFATSISLLLIHLLVYRPELVIDPTVGLPNSHAYHTRLRNILETKQHVQIVAIKFINANNIRTYLGEARYNHYVLNIAEQTEKIHNELKIKHDLYYEAPSTLYLIYSEESIDFDFRDIHKKLEQNIKAALYEIKLTGASLTPRICSIRCPEDLDSYNDIIQLGHEFYGVTPIDKYYIKASDIVGTNKFKIESHMDSILERAITENRLEMYYQPIYSVKDGRFSSAEALLRLKDREFGFISPGIFIPAAESRGLILPIGDFVIDAVFKFVAEHDLDELGLEYIEPNLSVAQCLQPELAEKIMAAQEKHGIDPKRINFEITETFFDNIGYIMDRNLKSLKDMGYEFSLDDYGTGYSNIQRVSKLPFSIIKIDKSLIDTMDTEDGMSLIRNTIQMMKDIRKEIVAEGVETKEILDKLSDMGCDFIQGFYFSKPLPEKEFLEFIKEHNKKRVSH